MKFALNGALTIGTLDGANIEIMQAVGRDNIFIFGKTADEIADYKRTASYDPRVVYRADDRIQRVVDALACDRFCPDEPGLFQWTARYLLEDGDRYFHLADFASYVEAQAEAERQFVDRRLWARKAVLNVARIGRFSSDRTVREYAADIWGVTPVPAT